MTSYIKEPGSNVLTIISREAAWEGTVIDRGWHDREAGWHDREAAWGNSHEPSGPDVYGATCNTIAQMPAEAQAEAACGFLGIPRGEDSLNRVHALLLALWADGYGFRLG